MIISKANPGFTEISRDLEGDIENHRNGGQAVASHDIDETLTPGGSTTEPYDERILEGIDILLELEDVHVTFNSGKPLDYQRELRDIWAEGREAFEEVDIIGGKGTVFELDGEVFHTDGVLGEVEYSEEEFIGIQAEVYDTLAENGWSANFQNNRSWGVGVTRIEAEGTMEHSRGETIENPSVSVDWQSTSQIFERYFDDQEGFEYIEDYERREEPEGCVERGVPNIEDNGAILLPEDKRSLQYATEFFRESFQGFRFEKTDRGTVFYRDRKDKDIEEGEVREEMENTIKEAAPEGWKYQSHDDGGFEYWHPDAGKLNGEKAYMKKLKKKGYTVTDAYHLGNGESDFIPNPDTVRPVPIEGTRAEEVAGDEYTAVRHPFQFARALDEVYGN